MNIDNSRKRYYLITLIFLVVITLFVISFFIFANRFVYQFATSIVLAIFLVFWGTTVYLRSVDKKLRRELLFIAGLELLWISLRIIKSFSYTTPVKNILWYLFYLPMIFMPSIWFIMIFDQRIKMAQKKKDVFYLIILIISSIALLLVLTNDLHQWVFIFKEPGTTPIDMLDYSYGIPYYFVIGWIFLLIISGVVLFYYGIKVNGIKAYIIPSVFILMFSLYDILHVVVGYPFNLINMAFVNVFFITCVLESILRIGLVSNTGRYAYYFERMNFNIYILDKNHNIILQNTKELLDNSVISYLKDNPEAIDYVVYNYKYGFVPIRAGNAIDKTNISSLLNLQKQIAETNDKLAKSNAILRNNAEIESRLKSVIARNELSKEVYDAISARLRLVKELSDQIPNQVTSENKEEVNAILSKIKFNIGYSKRKAHLILSAKETDFLTSEEIAIIFKNIEVDAQNIGIKSLFSVAGMGEVKIAILIVIFDDIYNLLENLNGENAKLVICAFFNPDFSLSIRVEGGLNIDEMIKKGLFNNLSSFGVTAENEFEENIAYITIKEAKKC